MDCFNTTHSRHWNRQWTYFNEFRARRYWTSPYRDVTRSRRDQTKADMCFTVRRSLWNSAIYQRCYRLMGVYQRCYRLMSVYQRRYRLTGVYWRCYRLMGVYRRRYQLTVVYRSYGMASVYQHVHWNIIVDVEWWRIQREMACCRDDRNSIMDCLQRLYPVTDDNGLGVRTGTSRFDFGWCRLPGREVFIKFSCISG